MMRRKLDCYKNNENYQMRKSNLEIIKKLRNAFSNAVTSGRHSGSERIITEYY